MAEPQIEQLFLVPGRTKAETAIWGAAVMEFAVRFPGVFISHDYTQAVRPQYDRITIVEPDIWPEELWTMIKQNPRRMRVEKLSAPSPEVLAEILHVRVYYGLRFGFQTGFDWAQQWPPGVSLIGLHGRADGEMLQPDLDIVRSARIEAVKLTSHASASTLEALRALNRGLLIVVRPIESFFDDDRPRRITPAEFVERTSSDLQRLFDYDSSIQYVEVHNEPNLVIEGLGGGWTNGIEFGSWFNDVAALYRKQWPYKKYGFPGLSPGGSIGGVRSGMKQFLVEAALAATRADWIGIHGYWQTERGMTTDDDGFTWRTYRQLFPDKLMFITEFGNPTQPKTQVAQQYARYYGILRHVSGLGGAFSYIVSTSDPTESARWAWRDESGNDVGIAHEIGLRRFIR